MPGRILRIYKDSFSGLQRNTWLLSLAMLINRSGSMVLLFTSLYLTTDLNFSISDAGFIMAFYGVGSVLGSYAGGWLTDKFNYYDIMVYSMISCGLILLLMLIATSMWFIITIIFFYGFASDMFRPANSVAIIAYSTPENRTRSVTLIRLAINLGFSVGPAAGGFIAMSLGYKWLFALDSLTSILAAVMLIIFLPRKNPEIQMKEKEPVVLQKSVSAYKNLYFLSFIILVALYGTCFFQLFASVPQYFSQVHHYDEDVIGLLLGFNGLLVVIIEMPLIYFLSKRNKAFSYIITGTLCLPVAFIILKSGNGVLLWAAVYTFVITMSEIFAMPFMMNYVLSKSPADRQGQYSALYSMSFALSIIAAPAVGLGIAGKYGFDTMFWVIIALSLIVAAGFAFLGNRKENALI